VRPEIYTVCKTIIPTKKNNRWLNDNGNEINNNDDNENKSSE